MESGNQDSGNSGFVFANPKFEVHPELGTIVPVRGGPATFTRATTAKVDDFEQVVRSALSGEARFTGLRRVRNLTVTASEDVTNAAWGKGAGVTAPTATRIVYDGSGAAGASRLTGTSWGTPAAGLQYRLTFEARWVVAPTGNIIRVNPGNYSGVGAQNYTLTSEWQRYSTAVLTSAGGASAVVVFQSAAANNDPFTLDVRNIQTEEVTGQTNQNPSEYVSVGVLSAPYHGANVDGVKYFSWENGNTVASNVVTEATGATIASATRLGYLAEGARTNICLQSEDLATTWTNTRSTESTNATTAPDGTSTADKLVEDATAANTHGLSQAITFTNAIHTISSWFKAGERTWVRLAANDGTTTFFCYFNLATGAVGTASNGSGSVKEYPGGWYRCMVTSTAATAAAAGSVIINIGEADNDITYDGDGTSGIYVWGAQVEAASFASSYIPTTTASVTRNADVLTYPFILNAGSGTFYAELGTIWGTGSGGQAAIAFANSVSGSLNTNSDLATSMRLRDSSGNQAIKTGLTDMSTGVRKRAGSWGASGLIVTGDGASVATGTFGGSMGSTAIAIGCATGGGSNWFGTIKNARGWLEQADSTQLVSITSDVFLVGSPDFAVPFTDLGSGIVDTTATSGVAAATFTRATTATTVGPTGLVIKGVASGSPRSRYDPTSLEYQGYFAEGARTNICLQSENLATTWTNTRSTETTNVTTAPDGTTTADKLVEDATAANTHFINQAITYTNVIYTASIWIKAAERSWFALQMNDGTTNYHGYFNLATGTVGSTANATATIQAYPGGWYRCIVVSNTALAAAAGFLRLYIAEADNDVSYDGDGTSGLYLWGAQVEAGSFASSYIPTTTASVTRNADVLTYPFILDATKGTFYAEVSSFGDFVGNPCIISTQAGAGSRLFSSGAGSIGIYDGTNSPVKSGVLSTATAVRKRAGSWGALGLIVTGNGAAVGSGAFDGAMSSDGIGIGCSTVGSLAWWGTIKNARGWTTQASSSYLQGMTT